MKVRELREEMLRIDSTDVKDTAEVVVLLNGGKMLTVHEIRESGQKDIGKRQLVIVANWEEFEGGLRPPRHNALREACRHGDRFFEWEHSELEVYCWQRTLIRTRPGRPVPILVLCGWVEDLNPLWVR